MLNDLFVIWQTGVTVKTLRVLSSILSILDAARKSPFCVSKEADHVGGNLEYSEGLCRKETDAHSISLTPLMGKSQPLGSQEKDITVEFCKFTTSGWVGTRSKIFLDCGPDMDRGLHHSAGM